MRPADDDPFKDWIATSAVRASAVTERSATSGAAAPNRSRVASG